MKLSLFLVASVLVGLPCVACSGSDASAPTPVDEPTATEDATKSFTFTCIEDTARLGKYDKNRFASLKLVLSGKKATIHSVVFSADYTGELTQEKANEEAFLAKGVSYDGKTPLTADERSQANKQIAELAKILAAGAGNTLAFAGSVKPYTRAPKKPTIQYPIDPTTAGIDADTLWGTLGNEGDGARVLLPPAMATGAAGKPDIEWEGTQGPMWDRYDCTK
jgi:hypothetical protein